MPYEAQLDMEITAERTSMAQEGLPSSYNNVTPFTPIHHLRNGILSFTEILLSNVEECSKPINPLPPPPPPIAFSGSDRFIKGRLPHRTLAISALLSSLFDEAMRTLSDVCKHGDVHADNAIAKTQTVTHEEMHGSDDKAPAASTQFNTSIHTDNEQKFDATVQVLSSNGMVDVSACSTDNSLEVKATCPQDGRSWSANDTADVATCDTYKLLPDDTQHAHGSDDAICQNLFEDDGRVQTLDKDGVSEGFDCSISTTKVLEGSLCVPDKIFESSTDDEMNQPISLFDTDSNIQTKVKTGHKRKVEEQEQLLKEVISTDMAGKVQLKQAKSGQKRPSKVARVLNYNGGGLLGVTSKVSAVSKISMGEGKDDGENQYAKLAATRARRDQVMGTLAVALCEKEDGASCPHSKGLTQHGLAGSEHDFAPEKRKVCLPMVLKEGLSTVDAGNEHNSSQAEVATTKPKRILTAEGKKKKQLKKHKKAYERRVGKIRVKPCIEKQKEKKPCHFYARGRCDKGVSCPLSHDITPITKSEICKYFINNCCLKGDDCPYSHALSTFPCKYFHTRGKCMEADSCRFSHEPISEEDKQKLLTKIEQEQQVREGNKATDRNSLGRIHPKYSVLPSDLELFPLGGKRGNRTPLKVTDAAASKMPRLDKIGTGSRSNNISEIPMLVAAKKAASTFIGGDSCVNAANLEVNKSMLHGSLLDPTGFLADKSSAICTTKSAPREIGLPLVQTTGLSRDSTPTQERKTKVDAFLQEQLNASHLMHKSKLGMGLESSGGCFTLLNQQRAMSMGQTSLLKAPNTSASRDRNAKAMMGSPHASVDHSHLTPTSKTTICARNKPKADFSIDQGKGFPNEESHHVVGIALVQMYGKCGQLTKAWHTFNIVQNRNVVLWTSLIGAYIEHGHDAKAFNCLKQMQAEGILPNPVWFICGLKAYGNMRAQDKGQKDPW